MQELSKRLLDLKGVFLKAYEKLSIDEKLSEVAKLEKEVAEPEIWRDVKLATAVMKAESKCDAEAKGDLDLVYEEEGRQYGYSMGAFQVRILPGREDCDTFDLKKNVECAYNIYNEAGREFTDWSMFNNGKYRDFLE